MTKPQLMIVDDELAMAEFVRDVGEDLGFEVKICTSAREFQEAYSLNTPSGIIMDVVIPHMDGNELLQWLVDQGSTTPVVLMSGYGGKYIGAVKILGQARGANVVGSLIKPIRLNDLKPVLQGIIDTANYC